MVAPLIAQAPIVPPGLTIPIWVISVAALIYYVVASWDRLRTKPAAHDVYLEKKEFERYEARVRIEISSLGELSEKRSKENRDLIQQKCNELERVITDKIADNKTSHTEQFGFLRGELHAVRGTMQAVSNDVSRLSGLLEGKKRSAH